MSCLSQLTSLLGLEHAASSSSDNAPVDLLMLGTGWTGTFLLPAAGSASLRIAHTTRDGGQGSIPFAFDPDSDDIQAFEALPDATTVLIVFPLYTEAAVKRLIAGYLSTRKAQEDNDNDEKKQKSRFILLGSTGIWDHGPTFAPGLTSSTPYASLGEHKHKDPKPAPTPSSPWKHRNSPHTTVPRAVAEDYFLSLASPSNPVSSSPIGVTVLNLCGLWGHGRSPRRFVSVLAPTKEKLAALGSVHFVHGLDVARAILALHSQWDKAAGERWILTNERVYDLWELCAKWGDAGEAGRNHSPAGPQPGWVQELIQESRSKQVTLGAAKPAVAGTTSPIRSLPRTAEQLGSALDGTDFWNTFGLAPAVPWVD